MICLNEIQLGETDLQIFKNLTKKSFIIMNNIFTTRKIKIKINRVSNLLLDSVLMAYELIDLLVENRLETTGERREAINLPVG